MIFLFNFFHPNPNFSFPPILVLPNLPFPPFFPSFPLALFFRLFSSPLFPSSFYSPQNPHLPKKRAISPSKRSSNYFPFLPFCSSHMKGKKGKKRWGDGVRKKQEMGFDQVCSGGRKANMGWYEKKLRMVNCRFSRLLFTSSPHVKTNRVETQQIVTPSPNVEKNRVLRAVSLFIYQHMKWSPSVKVRKDILVKTNTVLPPKPLPSPSPKTPYSSAIPFPPFLSPFL